MKTKSLGRRRVTFGVSHNLISTVGHMTSPTSTAALVLIACSISTFLGCTKSVDPAVAELTTVKAELQNATASKNTIEAELATTRASLSTAIQDAERYRAELDSSQKALASSNIQLQTEQQRNQQLAAQLQNLAKQQSVAATSRQPSAGRVAAVDAYNRRVKDEFEPLQKEARELQSAIAVIDKNLQTLRNQQVASTRSSGVPRGSKFSPVLSGRELGRAAQNLAELKRRYDTQRAEYLKRLNGVTADLSSIASQLAVERRRLESLK